MARNDHSGYPLKWFKDQNATRNAYECAICLEVLKDPVQVCDCGHQFCALCIDDILKIDPHCPTCRIKISDVMIFEDHAARRLIKQLVVNCCNEGCSWQGCLSSLLQVHQNNCNFSIHRGDDLDKKVEQLVQTLEIQLMLKISTLEKKYEQDIKELKLKLQRSENRLQLLEEKEKELCEKEKKTAAKEGYERLEIPRVYHPFIQGRNQETIQKIAMETNTKINIPPPLVPKDEITISGDKEGVALAKDKILRIYREKERHVTTVIEEKKSQHKYVTGPKGHALQEIFASTGASGEMPHLDSDTEGERGEPNRLCTGLTQAYERANRRANTEGISLAPSFGQLGRGISAGLSNSSQKQDQPMGNRFSALSGADMPPSQTYDARRSLSACASTGNCRSGSTTPLSNSTAQTESSTIQCKSRPYNTHLQVNQSSPLLQEMTENLKMFMDSQKEAQKEPEVMLLRADREATTENRASEIKEISDRIPENIENMVERKTGNENTVDPEPVEQIKSDNMDSGLDNSPNRVVDTKSLDSYVAHAVNSEKIEKKVEWLTDTKKSSEPPKKKSSKQRIKDINKKETGGNLMDAYTYKPPLQERVVENRVKPVELFPEQSDKPLEEDLSWEDERENIADENKMEKENDTEPAAPVKQTRRKYERDFLLQLQYMPLCTTKPAGLPDIEVVLDAPVQQGKQPPKKLYRKVMAILDKLTPQTFKTSVEQIMALNIDTPERLEVVVDRIFEKAISEPASSVIHANMCRCLFGVIL